MNHFREKADFIWRLGELAQKRRPIDEHNQLLDQYGTTLISAAVTGKFDVRAAGAGEPA